MPNCFQLTKKGESEPTPLSKIDEELCHLVGIEVHPTRYVLGWFDSIGWWIAVRGHDLGTEEIWQDFNEWFEPGKTEESKLLFQHMKNMLDYLNENYSSRGWVQIGK